MHITLMMVVTADGLIAKNDHHLPDWSSGEDKKLFKDLTMRAGVIMFGEKTFFTLPAPLPERLNVVFSEQLDPKPIQGVKWVSGDVSKVVSDLERDGYREAVLGGGAFLNSLFLNAKLIDEIIITVEPLLFGQGLNLFAKDANVKLKLVELKPLSKNAYTARYKVIY